LNTPLVSIIISTYNRAHLIGETLDSVLAQSYTHWECIVVDDGSTDTTQKLIVKYCEKDSRFQYHQRPKDRLKGANACRNYGFELCQGDYVQWFDSDDILHQHLLEYKIEAFESTNLDGVISKTKMFQNNISNICGKENRTKLTKNTLEDFLQQKLMWYLPDVLWKRDFLAGKKLFDEQLLAGQDRDFHARMLLKKPSLKILDRYLVYYRKHENSITKKINNTRNERLRRSHLVSLAKLIKLLKNENLLSYNLRIFFHGNVIKYLPAVFKSREHTILQMRLLATLSFFNLNIIVNWIKFCIAFISLKLFGKGERLLK